MSDKYKIGSVTVAALGGGWYELTHASLSEPKKVHGKEAADAEATKLDGEPDGAMQPQGDLTDPAAGGAGTPTPPPAPTQTPQQADEVAKLKEQLAAAEAKNAALQGEAADFKARFDEFLASAKPIVTTVEKLEDEASEPGVPRDIPREFRGEMDAKTKKALGRAGIKTKTIILEENESIPPTGLFLGHNGRSYMILPGEPVDVPDFLLGILDDAVMSAPQVDSKTQKVLGYRNRSKYPYRVVND